MKLAFITAVVAAVTASVVAVVPAFSTRSAAIPVRVRALEKKVKVLTTRLNRVQVAVAVEAACLRPVYGVSDYLGYIYTPDHGVTSREDSAIDLVGTGETPQIIMQAVDSRCVTTSGPGRSLARQPFRQIMERPHSAAKVSGRLVPEH
jgi:hypothetical protein